MKPSFEAVQCMTEWPLRYRAGSGSKRSGAPAVAQIGLLADEERCSWLGDAQQCFPATGAGRRFGPRSKGAAVVIVVLLERSPANGQLDDFHDAEDRLLHDVVTLSGFGLSVVGGKSA